MAEVSDRVRLTGMRFSAVHGVYEFERITPQPFVVDVTCHLMSRPAEAGASPRTLSRLFREQLGTSFAQWRSQLLLAHALTLAARGRPMSHIASELGYASASAFTAMVTRTVGMPPSRFFERA